MFQIENHNEPMDSGNDATLWVTIDLLSLFSTDAVHELYQAGIWEGVIERAAEKEIDLITLVGTSQDGTAHFETDFEDRLESHYELLADFSVRSNMDAFILFTSPITSIHGKEYAKKICARFEGRPVVCVSEPVPAYPSVLVDNGSGIESTMAHLVSVHNYRNIAFVKGPEHMKKQHNDMRRIVADSKQIICCFARSWLWKADSPQSMDRMQ